MDLPNSGSGSGGDTGGGGTLLIAAAAVGVSLMMGVGLLVAIVGGTVERAAASDCVDQSAILGPATVGEGSVRFAHANIKASVPLSGFRADLATATASGPDFVTLNESSSRATRDLAPPGYAAYRAAPTAPASQTLSTAVLWRTDRWDLVDGGRTLLVDDGPQRWDAGRSATWATLRARSDTGDTNGAGGPGGPGGVGLGTVSVVSVHQMINPAKYGPNRPLRQRLYAEGMARLQALVAELSAAGPVFVAGDFNSQYTDNDPWGPRAMLGAIGMRSTMDVLGKVTTTDGGGVIDYVFYQPLAATPASQQTRRLNSDHLAVVVDLEIGAAAAPDGDNATGATGDKGDKEDERDSRRDASGSTAAGTSGRGAATAAPAAAPASPASPATGSLPTVEGWSAEQVGNAAAIIAAGAELGVPARAQRIAVMTAIGESSLRILDYGDAAGPDSRGLFQQRANGAWGSLADRMDPRVSSINFYKALLRVEGWETLPPTIAAHRTQRNADPYHYEPYWEPAGVLMAALSGIAVSDTTGALGDCAPTVTSAGEVTWPLAPDIAASSDRHNWGNTGGNWDSWHTGTDFSVPCGTPVYASHAGTIEIDTSQAWAGRWLVKVAVGPGELTTWYAHMQALTVTDGQAVSAGQQIGEVGELGNATGCHLHFEVHTAGGSIYGPDNVNPSNWLADNVGQVLTASPPTSKANPTQGGRDAQEN